MCVLEVIYTLCAYIPLTPQNIRGLGSIYIEKWKIYTEAQVFGEKQLSVPSVWSYFDKDHSKFISERIMVYLLTPLFVLWISEDWLMFERTIEKQLSYFWCGKLSLMFSLKPLSWSLLSNNIRHLKYYLSKKSIVQHDDYN
jgi:hypothetical protein